jgi:hypothetical protein
MSNGTAVEYAPQEIVWPDPTAPGASHVYPATNVEVSFTYPYPEEPALEPVKIGPVRYEVKEIEELADEEKTLFGWIKYDSCEILIEAGLPDQVKRVTLWHEILHGILAQASQEHDEALVEALAYGLVAVFDDNPGLLAVFREDT